MYPSTGLVLSGHGFNSQHRQQQTQHKCVKSVIPALRQEDQQVRVILGHTVTPVTHEDPLSKTETEGPPTNPSEAQHIRREKLRPSEEGKAK